MMRPKGLSRSVALVVAACFVGSVAAGVSTKPTSADVGDPHFTAVAVSAAGDSSVALAADGTVWLWGNSYGVFAGNQPIPVQVPGLTDMVAIDGGGYFSNGLKADGTVWGWGYNGFGQLGAGQTSGSGPIQAVGLTDVTAIAAGASHALALKDDGTVWTWGSNTWGQLGIGTFADQSAPVQVPGLTGVIRVFAGGGQSFAIKADGTTWGWGFNQVGQLGDGTQTDQPSPVLLGISDIHQIETGLYGTIAVKTDGTVWQWPNFPSIAPAQVVGLDSIIQVDQRQAPNGEEFSVALRLDGTVYTWGGNTWGEIGNGTTSYQPTPQLVPGLSDVSSISAGGGFVLARLFSGEILSWGNNGSGQLGDASTTNRLTPTYVLASTDGYAICPGWGFPYATIPQNCSFSPGPTSGPVTWSTTNFSPSESDNDSETFLAIAPSADPVSDPWAASITATWETASGTRTRTFSYSVRPPGFCTGSPVPAANLLGMGSSIFCYYNGIYAPFGGWAWEGFTGDLQYPSGTLHPVRPGSHFVELYWNDDAGTHTQRWNYLVPGITGISPNSVTAGSPLFTLSVTGVNFSPASVVQWNGLGIPTAFISSSQLEATVSASLVASISTANISVTGVGSNFSLPLFVTQIGTSVTEGITSVNTVPGGSASATIGGSGPGTPGALTVEASGVGSVSLAAYGSNPGPAPLFQSSGAYFDVYTTSSSSFTSITFQYCDEGAGQEVMWYESPNWIPVSNDYLDSDTGCLVVTVDADSSPSLADLHGTLFTVRSGGYQPLPCGPGTYSATGNEPCDAAPAGTFVLGNGTTSAIPCPAGSYQPGTGATSCLPAPVGTYAAGIRNVAPTACPPGTTTAGTGSTNALDCVPIDSDADGTPDTSDGCPLLAGPATKNGCPDACLAPILPGQNVIIGTNKNDTLIGTPGNDVIYGLHGNDTIYGNGGDDIICAGAGNDRVFSGTGHDLISAGDGNDTVDDLGGNNTIDTGDGNDEVTTGSGNDFILTGDGNDNLDDSGGNNTVSTGSGNDKVTTGAGKDTISTGGGNNTIDAGAGDDVINAALGNDKVDGGPGFDVCNGGPGNNQVSNCEA